MHHPISTVGTSVFDLTGAAQAGWDRASAQIAEARTARSVGVVRRLGRDVITAEARIRELEAELARERAARQIAEGEAHRARLALTQLAVAAKRKGRS